MTAIQLELSLKEEISRMSGNAEMLRQVLDYARSLLKKPAAPAKTYSQEDQEILDGFREALLELKEIKAGRKQAIPYDEAMAQLRAELEAEEAVAV